MNKRKTLVIKDALGNAIYFPHYLCCHQNTCCEGAGVFDKVQDVIQKPALLLRRKENPTIHYYFRVVGMERSVLIFAEEVEKVWKAFQCIVNPEKELLLQLMAESEIIKSVDKAPRP
jgi:hypothetical protein